MSNVIIYGGGTISHVRNHLALCAPAFGTIARKLKQLTPLSTLVLTKMASETSTIITTEDLREDLKVRLLDPHVKVIILNAAICDFEGSVLGSRSGPHADRLQSRGGERFMKLTPADKLIGLIKEARPDIFVIGFKTTTGDSEDTQVSKALHMGVDLVLANDVVTRNNIIVGKASCIHRSDRGSCLEFISAIAAEVRGPILSETDERIAIDIEPNGYLTKTAAFQEALKLAPEGVYDILRWDDWNEGVFWLTKLKGEF